MEEKEALLSEQPEVKGTTEDEFETAVLDLKQKLHVQHKTEAKQLFALACTIFILRTNTTVCEFATRLGWITPVASLILCILSMVAKAELPSYKMALGVLMLLSAGVLFGTPSIMTAFGRIYLMEPIMVFSSTAQMTYAQLRRPLHKWYSVWLVLLASYLTSTVVGAGYYFLVPDNGTPGMGIPTSVLVPASFVLANDSTYKKQFEEKEALPSEQPEVKDVEAGTTEDEFETAVLDLKQKLHVQHKTQAKQFFALACTIFMLRTNTIVCEFATRLGWITPVASLILLSMVAMAKLPSYKMALGVLMLLSVGVLFGTPSIITAYGQGYSMEPVMVLGSTAQMTYAQLRRPLHKWYSVWLVLLASCLTSTVVGAGYYFLVPDNGTPGMRILTSVLVPASFVLANDSTYKKQYKLLEDKHLDGL